MKQIRGPFALLAALAAASPACAQSATNITLDHGSVWQTEKLGDPTEGFLQIHNLSAAADKLTSWSCPIADNTALVGADGKKLDSLSIPANGTVTLSQNGPHLVLTGLHYTVQFGGIVPCAFTFALAGDIGGYLNAVAAPGKSSN